MNTINRGLVHRSDQPKSFDPRPGSHSQNQRTSLNTTRFASFFGCHDRAGAVASQLAIVPGYNAPIVRPTVDGERELITMSCDA